MELRGKKEDTETCSFKRRQLKNGYDESMEAIKAVRHQDQEHTPKCSKQMPQETYAILPDQGEPLGKTNSNVLLPLVKQRVQIKVVPAMSTPSKNSGLLCISKGRGVGTRRTRALLLPARTAFKDSRNSCSYFVCSLPTRNN